MTLFEIIIICIVAALFVATIFVFIVCTSYIKQVHITNKQVVTLTNVAFECRSFLEKVSKHDVIVKINNITGLEKKVGEVLSICKNQTNNITQVRDNLDKALEDIKMRNNLIRDNHKLLDNINKSNSSTTINKNIFTAYEDIKEKLLKINQQYTIISNSINATSEFIKTINDELNNFSDAIDNVIKNNKINNDEIAKISSILDTYREKVNYITTWIENATKLKTAFKSKTIQTKTTTTPIDKKGVQKYL